MAQPQYSLTWDAYQSSICGGFTALQQNGEMVDMTLAADGHVVKVHQVLMAVASPFLKELINSAPCKHPVIFLNNVSHNTLCYLLEYVYTGEVLVPAPHFSAFIKTAKELHIRGLENVMQSGNTALSTFDIDNAATDTVRQTTTTPAPLAIDLPLRARKVHMKNEKTGAILATQSGDTIFSDSTPMDDSRNYSDDDDDVIPGPVITSVRGRESSTSNVHDQKSSVSSLQFTVSNRGSLQVILNRYLYNLTSTGRRDGLRRWRCVDYRTSRCPAFVVTKGSIVSSRSNMHNHQFHDKKILGKIERNAVYTALDELESKTNKDKAGGIKDFSIQQHKADTDNPIEEEIVHSTRSMVDIPGVNKNI